MAYSAQADWELAAGGLDRLTELSDFDESGQLNLDVLERKVADVDDLINAFLRERGFTVPLSTVPPAIRALSAAETLFELRQARGSANDSDRAMHEQRWARLPMVLAFMGDRATGAPSTPPSNGTRSVDAGDEFARDAWSRGGFG